MKRSTFKVLFYLKRRSEKNGKAPIMGRITVNGTVSQFSCKLSVSPKLWDTEGNRAAGKSVEARRINEKLDNIRTNISKQYQRISDRDSYVTAVKKLTHDDIHTDGNGDMWIIDGRQKTDTQFRVQLLPVARELVERYYRLSLPGGTVFPVKSCCSTIRSLRAIARRAGIATDLTTHVARHSFATSVCLSQGVPLETASKMLGHKHIATTQIYAKITNDKIERDMTALEAKIGDKFRLAQ